MNLCDDFYCTDGLPIDKSPLFKGSLDKGAHTKENPDMGRYENRDPRMKATLMLPGMEWNGKLYTNNLHASSTCCKHHCRHQKAKQYTKLFHVFPFSFTLLLIYTKELRRLIHCIQL